MLWGRGLQSEPCMRVDDRDPAPGSWKWRRERASEGSRGPILGQGRVGADATQEGTCRSMGENEQEQEQTQEHRSVVASGSGQGLHKLLRQSFSSTGGIAGTVGVIFGSEIVTWAVRCGG